MEEDKLKHNDASSLSLSIVEIDSKNELLEIARQKNALFINEGVGASKAYLITIRSKHVNTEIALWSEFHGMGPIFAEASRCDRVYLAYGCSIASIEVSAQKLNCINGHVFPALSLIAIDNDVLLIHEQGAMLLNKQLKSIWAIMCSNSLSGWDVQGNKLVLSILEEDEPVVFGLKDGQREPCSHGPL
jgi:hypothetical protein